MNPLWWFNSGDRGFIRCGYGHQTGRGWLYRARGRLYCRACAIRLFKVTPPPLLNWPGWALRDSRLHNRFARVLG